MVVLFNDLSLILCFGEIQCYIYTELSYQCIILEFLSLSNVSVSSHIKLKVNFFINYLYVYVILLYLYVR